MTKISLLVERGRRLYETLPAVALGGDRYKLLASPGMVLGIAKGDEIKMFAEGGEFELINRGGNLCIQLYKPPDGSTNIDSLAEKIETDRGGTLDGWTHRLAVFSVPVRSGFNSVEIVMDDFVRSNMGCEWCYGNVYDDNDVPLNWW